jgi:hypothetical protein
MEKQAIKPGVEYAIREPVAAGVEFQRVKILENVRGSRWRAQWIEPNTGLVEYISSKNVIVEWSQRKAFLWDEQHAAALTEHLARIGYRGDDHPVSRAVSEVFEAAGEPDLLFRRGELEFEPDVLDRLADRAGLPAPTRHGRRRRRRASATPAARTPRSTTAGPTSSTKNSGTTSTTSPQSLIPPTSP